LLSVTDKTGLVDLAQALQQRYRVELWASGGTRRHLEQAGIRVQEISQLTGFPELLDGRVKTLHPAVYAGLLARRDQPEHLQQLEQHRLLPWDLVVCNLYPFEQVVNAGASEADAIENIDIGGPCMIRAAAKNCAAVAVLVEPQQYAEFLDVLAEHEGQTPLEYRRRLATHAFDKILRYDAAIAAWFREASSEPNVPRSARQRHPEAPAAPAGVEWPEMGVWIGQLVQRLRYGENPHQQAALYRLGGGVGAGLVQAKQFHGKELSYNNWLDLDAAWNAVWEFTQPACVIVKHTNPCGVATASTLAQALQHAWAADPVSAFGGIIACNRCVDSATAATIVEAGARRFIECLIAPDYEQAAREQLCRWKENMRLLQLAAPSTAAAGPPALMLRSISGGLLVQTADSGAEDPEQWQEVTQRRATARERAALAFAWRVCKHVKSNAIVLARAHEAGGWETVGIGAGQMSRVEAVRQAVHKAGERAREAVLASDAFFPFPDNVELAAAAGITAIVQPGGSIRDAESLAAADRHGLAMLLTHVRHFRH
jgi:phosphoribosylaminoimidazolecarboxamide formyltransferase/IMP cyclohydrolase